MQRSLEIKVTLFKIVISFNKNSNATNKSRNEGNKQSCKSTPTDAKKIETSNLGKKSSSQNRNIPQQNKGQLMKNSENKITNKDKLDSNKDSIEKDNSKEFLSTYQVTKENNPSPRLSTNTEEGFKDIRSELRKSNEGQKEEVMYKKILIQVEEMKNILEGISSLLEIERKYSNEALYINSQELFKFNTMVNNIRVIRESTDLTKLDPLGNLDSINGSSNLKMIIEKTIYF